MKKTKKAATQKKQGRQRTDWMLFLRLCKEGRTNEQIAKRMAWPVSAKSKDAFKRVRAAKSLARTRGVKVAGRVLFLRDRRLKGVDRPKPAKTKQTKTKAAGPQPSPQSLLESKLNE